MELGRAHTCWCPGQFRLKKKTKMESGGHISRSPSKLHFSALQSCFQSWPSHGGQCFCPASLERKVIKLHLPLLLSFSWFDFEFKTLGSAVLFSCGLLQKMNYQVSKMRLTLKRILQALFVAVLFSFSTLAVLRTLASNSPPTPVAAERPADPWIQTLTGFWPDRSLRSVAEDVVQHNEVQLLETAEESSFDPVTTQPPTTATAKVHTTLDDIFISVKTTKNFHASRLDVIIKTWFTLARDQVFLYVSRLFYHPALFTCVIMMMVASRAARLGSTFFFSIQGRIIFKKKKNPSRTMWGTNYVLCGIFTAPTGPSCSEKTPRPSLAWER